MIDVSAVRDLRALTSLPVMDCKRALQATDGDVAAAAELLRKQGAKLRPDRVTREGVVAAFIDDIDGAGAMIELNCETDFTARTDAFNSLANYLAGYFASNPDPVPDSPDIRDPISELSRQTGEKIVLSRWVRYTMEA